MSNPLPNAPLAPDKVPLSKELRAYLGEALVRWDTDLVRALRAQFAEIRKGPVWFGWTALPGADGVKVRFSVNDPQDPLSLGVTLWLDGYKRPVVMVMQGGAPAPYVDATSPPAGCWTLELGPPQVMVFGTAPLATDAIQMMATTT